MPMPALAPTPTPALAQASLARPTLAPGEAPAQTRRQMQTQSYLFKQRGKFQTAEKSYSSDLDENLTESIAATQTLIFKNFPGGTASKKMVSIFFFANRGLNKDLCKLGSGFFIADRKALHFQQAERLAKLRSLHFLSLIHI